MKRLLRGVFLLLDVLFVLAFLLGYAARYISPWRFWWVEFVAIGLPYMSLFLLVLLPGLLLARWWKTATLHAVLLGLALLRFVPLSAAVFREPAPEDLVVMTLNLPSSHAVGIPPERHEAEIRDLLSTVRPDLAAFQESTYLTQMLDGPRMTLPARGEDGDAEAYHFTMLEGRSGPVPLKEPMLTHLPTEEPRLIRLVDDPDSDAYAVRTEFEWQGRRAVHYNVHLESFHVPPEPPPSVSALSPRLWLWRILGSREAVRTRAEEAVAIRRMMDEEELPIILTGDFNSTAHTWAFRQIATGLTDAFKVGGGGWGATWHARFPFARIDFILVGPEWEVVSADVIDVELSDHRPLTARLRWR